MNKVVKKIVSSSLCVGVILSAGLISGCGMTGFSPFEASDGAPARKLDAAKIRDAVPRPDPIKAAGNSSPYEVFGKTYTVLESSQGYKKQGIASWYGTKFHGRPTANGEPYSLYEMTAAHKHLPIPSYVQVKNLANGRTAVVRVNDRGPFHENRIIDLSYAAAVKLGFAEKGTARVEVTALPLLGQQDLRFGQPRVVAAVESPLVVATPAPKPVAVTQPARKLELAENERFYVQLGAFSVAQSAHKVRVDAQKKLAQYVEVLKSPGSDYHRVRVGPFASNNSAQQMQNKLLALGFNGAAVVTGTLVN